MMICPKCSRSVHEARTCLYCGALLSKQPGAIVGKNALQWRQEGARVAQLRQFERALKAFENALAIEPDNGLAWLNKAMTLRELGRSDEAIAAMRTAAELDPGDPTIRRALRMYPGAGLAAAPALAATQPAAAVDPDADPPHRGSPDD
jgi:tetratricopeptide (TPR) repeat protein